MERVAVPPCHKPVADACCDDETVVHDASSFNAVQGTIDLSAPVSTDADQPLILIAEIVPEALPDLPYRDYNPPQRSFDRTIEHQVLLI